MAKKRKLTLKQIADEWERAINMGEIEWLEITPQIRATLNHWTVKYLDWFESCGIKCQISRQLIEQTLVLKTDDPVICYFHHDPILSCHQWVGEGFHKALEDNDAIAYLASKKNGNFELNKAILELLDKVMGETNPQSNPELN